jgi:Tfp pilus assembly protein PilX
MNSISTIAPAVRQKGISLIVVLIMTVVIGLTAAAAMRGATSNQRVTNNIRMDAVAQQYAEAALRYCETQLQIPATNVSPQPTRVNSLVAANIPVVNMTVAGTVGAWENTVTWMGAAGAGGAAATRTPLTSGQYSSVASSYLPAKAPECVAETQILGSPTFTVAVITARGFSTDYVADSTSGRTKNGSVVWLQSVLNLCAGSTPTCP